MGHRKRKRRSVVCKGAKGKSHTTPPLIYRNYNFISHRYAVTAAACVCVCECGRTPRWRGGRHRGSFPIPALGHPFENIKDHEYQIKCTIAGCSGCGVKGSVLVTYHPHSSKNQKLETREKKQGKKKTKPKATSHGTYCRYLSGAWEKVFQYSSRATSSLPFLKE